MKKSVLVLVLASLTSLLVVGCVSSAPPSIAFEPRVYPFVPQVGTTEAK